MIAIKKLGYIVFIIICGLICIISIIETHSVLDLKIMGVGAWVMIFILIAFIFSLDY